MSRIVSFDKARGIQEDADMARTAEIDLDKVEYVRWLTGKQVFSFAGVYTAVDLPVQDIARSFEEAGIGIYVLTDNEKDAPIIVPIANIDRADRWNGITSLYLKKAHHGAAELLIRETPADFQPWQGATPPAL